MPGLNTSSIVPPSWAALDQAQARRDAGMASAACLENLGGDAFVDRHGVTAAGLHVAPGPKGARLVEADIDADG